MEFQPSDAQIHPNAVLCCFRFMAATIGIELFILPKVFALVGYAPAVIGCVLVMVSSPLIMISQRKLSEHFGQSDYFDITQAALPCISWKKLLATIYFFACVFDVSAYLWVIREIVKSLLPCSLLLADTHGLWILAAECILLALIEAVKGATKRITRNRETSIEHMHQTTIRRCIIDNISIAPTVPATEVVPGSQQTELESEALPPKLGVPTNEGETKLLRFDPGIVIFIAGVLFLLAMTIVEFLDYKLGDAVGETENITCEAKIMNKTAHDGTGSEVNATEVWAANASNITLGTPAYAALASKAIVCSAFVYALVGHTTMLGVCDTAKRVPLREFTWKIYLSSFATTLAEIGICTIVFLNYGESTSLIYPMSFHPNIHGTLAKISAVLLCLAAISSRFMPSCHIINSKLFGPESGYQKSATLTAVLVMILSFTIAAVAPSLLFIIGIGAMMCAVLQIGIPLVSFIVYVLENNNIRERIGGFHPALGDRIKSYQDDARPLVSDVEHL